MRLRPISICRLEFIRLECTQNSSKYGVRVRFAPSPTGKMHLGGLRTALYNFLFSRSHNGKFILRIEDTDQKRAVVGVSQQIERTLDYYGLKRDEGPCEGGPFGPYVQSSRLMLYKEAAERLVDSDHAYRCFCTKERLDMLRREALKRRETPGYDNHCRSLSNDEIQARMRDNLPFVVRFKLKSEPITFHDEVFGDVSQTLNESDFIILKSDSYPTYHMANVVDDHMMRISHVIRGMEWLSSTPKHIQLYRAFEWNQPKWVHLPLITRDGSKKLSKRDQDSFVEFYHEHEGYLPLAVINFLLRNGSGIRNFNLNHLYTIDELIENFDVNTIGRRNFMMDRQSLDQYGRLAFENVDFDGLIEDEIVKYVKKHFDCDEGLNELINDTKYLKKVIAFLRNNEETFSRISQLSSNQFKFLFSYPSDSKKITDEFDRNLAIAIIKSVRNCDDRSLDALKRLANENDMKYPRLLHLIRLALIDNSDGPPILELFDFFGEQQCNERFDRILGMLQNN